MLKESTFRYSRFLFLRGLGLLYAVAFWGIYQDGLALLGSNGLTPIDLHIEKLQITNNSGWSLFSHLPSLFWFGYSDSLFQAYSIVGLLGALLLMAGVTNAILSGVLWALYLSFVSLGQTWFAFGWEIQLIETGFLAIFLCPALSWRPFPSHSPPSKIVIVAGWWLIARIMLGSGLIKIRGDACWLELTCLQYHFETQPIPGPFSPLFHNLTNGLLEWGVIINHFIELFCPFLLLGPRRLRHFAAFAFVAFQLILILSGNLAFLNWLTLLPCLLCIDDGVWEKYVPRIMQAKIAQSHSDSISFNPLHLWFCRAYGMAVVLLSFPIVANLWSSSQSMNRSFFRVPIVNTYGAFGSVSRTRVEITIEGRSQNGEWLEYALPCKPGPIDRHLCWITPFHYRLDWLSWFAGLEAANKARLGAYPWLLNLSWKLLQNNSQTLSLMGENPFQDAPPHEIRIRLHQYRFSNYLQNDSGDSWQTGVVWSRKEIGVWLSPVSLEHEGFKRYIVNQGWATQLN